MGKATISGGGTDGNYEITIDFGTVARQDRVMALTNKIAELSTKITEAQGKYDTEKAKVDTAKLLVSEAIDAYVLATKASENPEDWKDELATFQKRQAELFAAQAKAEPLRLTVNDLKSEKAQAIKDKGQWESLELEVTQQAWCVDLTEDAAGEVATVDVPGESAQILIAPGGRAHMPSDGLLTAREVQSAEQVFFNAAILPGWQKFKPTYRVGIIIALNLDADTADVTLVAANSSAQNLNVNRDTDLPGIPVNYMTCNAAAFQVGDRVIVQFAGQDWSGATVIGFESNPKPCLPEYIDFDWQLVFGAWQTVGASRTVFRQLTQQNLLRFYLSPPAASAYTEVAGQYIEASSDNLDMPANERSVTMVMSEFFYPSEEIEGVGVEIDDRNIWTATEGLRYTSGSTGPSFSPSNPFKYRVISGNKILQRIEGYELSGETGYAGGLDIVDEVPGVTLINEPLGLLTASVVVPAYTQYSPPDMYPQPAYQNFIGPALSEWEAATSPPATVDVTRGSVSVEYPFDGWHEVGGAYVMRYRRPGSSP